MRKLAIVLSSIAALAVVVEGGFALIRHVALFQSTDPLLETARMLYLERRNMIQFMDECARYDTHTSYVLRPGACAFSNAEFDTAYRINRLGLRDDEDSLLGPEIVVLGDSYAMGWGVEQDETIASVLERATGLKTLNAAISSHGTVRELRLLSRIDTSKMRYLLIQYAGNDHGENMAYVDGNDRLDIMPEDAYDALVEQHVRRRTYYPGAYTVTYLRARLQGMKIGRPAARRVGPPARATAESVCAAAPRTERALSSMASEQVHAFLHALTTSPVDLNGVTIVVVAVSTGPGFIEGLQRAIDSATEPKVGKVMKACDAAFLLSEADFFRLDDHLRPQGHAIIAEHVHALFDL